MYPSRKHFLILLPCLTDSCCTTAVPQHVTILFRFFTYPSHACLLMVLFCLSDSSCTTAVFLYVPILPRLFLHANSSCFITGLPCVADALTLIVPRNVPALSFKLLLNQGRACFRRTRQCGRRPRQRGLPDCHQEWPMEGPELQPPPEVRLQETARYSFGHTHRSVLRNKSI